MDDFILLLVAFVLTIGLTAIAFWSRFRFLPGLMAGAIWIAMAYLVLEFNLILLICCIGMAFYMFIRSLGY